MGYPRDEYLNTKVPQDEPVFILRAQDKFAAAVIEVWCVLVAMYRGDDHPKVVEARMLAKEIREWQLKNNCKVPD